MRYLRLKRLYFCIFTVLVVLYFEQYTNVRIYPKIRLFEEKPSWLKDADMMTKINESILRCGAEDIGCFGMLPTSPTIFDLEMTREECLDFCFQGENAYAGLSRDKKCYCTNSMKTFTSSKPYCDIGCSIDKGNECRTFKSVRMFHKRKGCFKGSDNMKPIGCIPLSKISTTKVRIWSLDSGMTEHQCLLKCEETGLILAIPVSKYQACICTDLWSMFTFAENMRATIQTCIVDESTDSKEFEETYPVYRTFVEECAPRRFLKRWQGPFTILTSFWGSGNTWLRHLIEIATGIYTGSVYRDNFLYDGGMLGEMLQYYSGRTIIIKDHLLVSENLFNRRYKAAVLILRNPYDATLAEFARARTHNNHTAILDPKMYESDGFKQTVAEMPRKWFDHARSVIKILPSVMVVYYEDLVKNPIAELRRILEYLPPNLIPQGEELEQRLMCMNLDMTGNFKRGSKGIRSNPFTDELIELYDDFIVKTDNLLKSKNMTGLPSSYFEPWHL